MSTKTNDDPLQLWLLEHVFARGHTPHTAIAAATPHFPNRTALEAVYLLTLIATELDASFQPDASWTYTDWLEAAAALACDVYAATQLGAPNPTLADIAALGSAP